MKLMKNALVILAGGKGSRMGSITPKQFNYYGKHSFVEYLLNNISLNLFELIVISCKKKYVKKYFNKIKQNYKNHKIIWSESGINRQESSMKALKKLKLFKPKNVLIHDSARPLASNKLFKKIILNLKKEVAVVPYVTYNDKKIINLNEINEKIKNIQTPQGFRFDLIYLANLKYKKTTHKDDSSLIQKLNKKIKYIKGEKTNLKITYPEDISFFKSFQRKYTKVGIGYDIHKFNFQKKNNLLLCGVKIPYYKLTGHSDADVGIHAICDSIFGSLSMNDIGYYFSNTNPKWKNANSAIFLNYCKKKLIEKGFYINNLDINFICEKPNINKYRFKMIKNISKLLSIPTNIISIKATTNEKIGFIGDGLGIAAESIVQISNEKFY